MALVKIQAPIISAWVAGDMMAPGGILEELYPAVGFPGLLFTWRVSYRSRDSSFGTMDNVKLG